jgi:hypothetical protein
MRGYHSILIVLLICLVFSLVAVRTAAQTQAQHLINFTNKYSQWGRLDTSLSNDHSNSFQVALRLTD